MKHWQLKPEFEHLKNYEKVFLLDTAFGNLRKLCLRGYMGLTLGGTVDFILQQDLQFPSSNYQFRRGTEDWFTVTACDSITRHAYPNTKQPRVRYYYGNE
jgi:hypothetical protein